MILPFKILCKCGNVDLPENFHYYEGYSSGMRMYYMICPECGAVGFMTHFKLDVEGYTNPKVRRACLSHAHNTSSDIKRLESVLNEFHGKTIGWMEKHE